MTCTCQTLTMDQRIAVAAALAVAIETRSDAARRHHGSNSYNFWDQYAQDTVEAYEAIMGYPYASCAQVPVTR